MASQIETSNKIILDVPYYSQFIDIKNSEWKPRACTIVCLKMTMDFLRPVDGSTADDLFDQSEQIKQSLLEKELITQKLASNGSVHDCIVFLAHNHGLPAYKEEFKSLDKKFGDEILEFGIKKIATSVANGTPVIVSVLPGLSNGQSFHTILIVGSQSKEGVIDGFIYHDPDSEDGTLRNQFISLDKFKEYWRRLAIFFG